MWFSHGSTLANPPESWDVRTAADVRNLHPLRGRCCGFDELKAMCAEEDSFVQYTMLQRECAAAGCKASIGCGRARMTVPDPAAGAFEAEWCAR